MLRYYVTDRTRANLLSSARRAIDAGVDMIQVREKDMDGGALLRLVRQIVDAAEGTRTRVLVNGRLDVAVAARADGVHLPANGLPVASVRSRTNLVGISTHSLDEVQRAEADGADFVVFGPIFATPGKTAVGLDRLIEVTRGAGIAVYGIGGITTENAPDVIAAGAAGIAGIRLFQS